VLLTIENRFGAYLRTSLERPLERLEQESIVATVISLAGLLMTVVDHGGFPSIGAGLWWAVQTVTTVGYGDHVPTTVGGQLLAALVMLLGIGFITVITASITSSFISRARLERPPTGDSVLLAEQLKKIDERLGRIESALGKLQAP
jgi:voltage-gated potassium channel Kch